MLPAHLLVPQLQAPRVRIAFELSADGVHAVGPRARVEVRAVLREEELLQHFFGGSGGGATPSRSVGGGARGGGGGGAGTKRRDDKFAAVASSRSARDLRPTLSTCTRRNSAAARAMLAIYALSFLDLFSVGLIKPLLPSLLQSKQIGATAYAGVQAIGATASGVNSACHAAGLLLSPFIGRLSDVRGRKSGIVVSAFVAFVGCVCYGLALTTNSYAPAVVGRLLHNLGHVAIMAPLNATIAGRSESGGAARLSMMMGIFGLGYAAGSAGGGWLGGFGAAPVLAVLSRRGRRERAARRVAARAARRRRGERRV